MHVVLDVEDLILVLAAAILLIHRVGVNAFTVKLTDRLGRRGGAKGYPAGRCLRGCGRPGMQGGGRLGQFEKGMLAT